MHFLERFLRPRPAFLHEQFIYWRLAEALTALSDLLLLLPLPVPFSNGFAAWTILLLAAAGRERDGLCFIAGCALFAVTTTSFPLLAFRGTSVPEAVAVWGRGIESEFRGAATTHFLSEQPPASGGFSPATEAAHRCSQPLHNSFPVKPRTGKPLLAQHTLEKISSRGVIGQRFAKAMKAILKCSPCFVRRRH